MVDLKNAFSPDRRRVLKEYAIDWTVAVVLVGFVAALGVGLGILVSRSQYSSLDEFSMSQGSTQFVPPPMSSYEPPQVTTLVIDQGETVWGEIADLYPKGERYDSNGFWERFVQEEIAWLEARLDRDLDLVFPGEVIRYSVPGDWAQVGETVVMYEPESAVEPVEERLAPDYYEGLANNSDMDNGLCNEPAYDC